MATKKTTSTNSSGKKIALGAALVTVAAAGYFLFGPKGAQNRKKVKGWTLKAKGEILEKLEKLEEVSEEQYHAIVDAVIAKYAKAKDKTTEEVAAVEKEAKKYWNSIKKDLAGKVSKTAKKAEKTASKVKKTAEKEQA